MQRRALISALSVTSMTFGLLGPSSVHAAAVSPDAFIQALTEEVVAEVRADKDIQAGDVKRILTLVDTKVMVHFNFQRMTGSSVGPAWRDATPDQRVRTMVEFQKLMVRTYAGALSQVKDKKIVVRPLRAGEAELDTLIVRSEVLGNGEPMQIDYRVERLGDAWKILDVNVAGIWLAPAYRGQFAKDINAGGIEALILALAAKNKSAELN